MKKQSKIRKYWELIDVQYEIATEVSKLEVAKARGELDEREKYTALEAELREIELETTELRSELQLGDFEYILVECLE